MKAFEKLCWVVVLIMGAIASVRLVLLAFLSGGSPADYVGLCAMVIIPYVFTRAVQGFSAERLQGH